MIPIGLIGGRGYVAEELLGLLANHPDFEVVFASSRTHANVPVRELIPGLNTDLVFSPPDARHLLNGPRIDAWVIAQDNGQARRYVEMLEHTEPRIIDVSSDYRLDENWVYGLPELNRKAIRHANRVANPGCYATAVQLALLPLVDWLGDETPVAFGVSGHSGAGRTPNERNDPERLRDNLIPYALSGHSHEKEASRHLGRDVRIIPHVAPFFRGISITLSARLREPASESDIAARFAEWYGDSPLVKCQPEIPQIRNVRDTNLVLIGGWSVDSRDPRHVVLVSVLDNLRKGAASQVVANLNLMFDRPETTGLVP